MRILVMALSCASLVGCSRAAAQPDGAKTNGNAHQSNTNDGNLPANLKAKNIRQETVTTRPDTDEAAGGRRVTVLSDMGDRKFVDEAAKAGMAEVEMGRLAAQKGESPAVRQLGERIADDHAKANAELRQLAEKQRFGLPVDMSPEQKRKIEALSKKSGKAFDQDYLATMIKDHDKDIQMFKHEASRASADPGVKVWAQQTLPVLEHHGELAHQRKGAVKKEK